MCLDSSTLASHHPKLTTGDTTAIKWKRLWQLEEWMICEQNASRFRNMVCCRCFLEGGGSTDSFFVREDLQVDSVKK